MLVTKKNTKFHSDHWFAGPLSNGTERNAQDTENQPSSNDFKPALKAAKECCTKSFKKVRFSKITRFEKLYNFETWI